MYRDGSSVMFPLRSQRVSGLATSDSHRPNDPVGIDLIPTPIPTAKLRIFHAGHDNQNGSISGYLLIGLRAFDLVSSRVWWEAVTNNYPWLSFNFAIANLFALYIRCQCGLCSKSN